MDINDLRSAVTVISLGLFLALVAWTWRRGRKAAFDAAARLPFEDEATDDGNEDNHNDRRPA
jgi:cytochrome c oxidase cbb3-type subunit 4